MDEEYSLPRSQLKTAFMALAFVAGVLLFVCVLGYYFAYTLLATGEDTWSTFQANGMFLKSAPSLSSDGRLLTYTSMCTGHGDIYVYDTVAHDFRRATQDPRFESNPLVASDQNGIAFCREENGWRHIWLMNVDGSKQRRITTGSALDDLLEFSGDGKYLLFYRSHTPLIGNGKSGAAYLLRTDSTTAEPIRIGVTAILSPDGRQIVTSDEQSVLWSLALGDESEMERTRLDVDGWPLGFSPDGKYLLTSRGSRGIWIHDIAGNTEHRVAKGNTAALFGMNPTYVLSLEGLEQVPYVRAVDGTSPVQIACPPGGKTFPRVCQNGTSVVFATSLSPGSPEYDIVTLTAAKPFEPQITAVRCGAAGRRNE